MLTEDEVPSALACLKPREAWPVGRMQEWEERRAQAGPHVYLEGG